MEVRRLPESELYHHGIKGQKWGVRRYQNPDGSLTAAGQARYTYNERNNSHSIDTKYIKRAAIIIGAAAGIGLAAYVGYRLHSKYAPYFLDKTLKNKKLYTLTANETFDDISDKSRIYAYFKKSDDNLYKRKYAKTLLERNKSDIEFGKKSLNRINQIVTKTKETKIASIKNTENLFENTYNKNDEFRKSIDSWFKSSEFTSHIGGSDFRISELYSKAEKGDLKSKYELFNKFGYSNRGNEYADNAQKTFKKVLNNNGYNAIYDLNDIRGDYKSKSPIIILNPDNLINQYTNKIYNRDVKIAKEKFINNENIDTLYKYISGGLLTTSAATYGTTKAIEKTKEGKKHGS